MVPMSTKTLALSIITSRDLQGLEFMAICEAAYNEARLTEGDEAQRVNDTPGLADLLANFIGNARATDKYKDEEVRSNYGYLSGFQPGVQDLNRQIARLKDLFPGLAGANSEFLELVKSGKVELPPNTEKWGALPNWKKRSDLFGPLYNDGVQKVLDEIKETRNGAFYNYRDGQIGPNQLRQTKKLAEFTDKLIEQQGSPDILIVPFQFGLLYAGNSVRRAREKFILSTEFGLGWLWGGCLLLTHEERLQHYNDLWIDLPGDEYDDPDSDVRFDHAPYFNFNNDKVKTDTNRVDNQNEKYGSASGSLPSFSKSLLHRQKVFNANIFCYFIERIQPPSILPISSTKSCRIVYFLRSREPVSFIRRMVRRRVLSFTLARSKIGVLLVPLP